MTEGKETNTKAILSLTMGILSILTVLTLPLLTWVLGMGMVGLAFGIISLREIKSTFEAGRNLAITGLISSMVGIIIALVRDFS